MSADKPTFLEHDSLRLLLFGGKGGVGKTTCAVATALHLARQFPQRTFLLASIDPAHSVSDCLNGPVPCPNLQCLEIDFRQSLEKFKEVHASQLRQIALRGTFLDEDDVGQLLRLSIPGFDELMAFTEIAGLVKSHRYSCIILDTAPTGHTLRFLELPQLMRGWLEALDGMLAKHRYLVKLYGHGYRKDDLDLFLEDQVAAIEVLAALLSDATQCQFIPVMLAEPLCTYETRRLMEKLAKRRIAVSDILVNRLYPATTTCPTCHEAQRRQQEELGKLTPVFRGHSLWAIPLQGGEVRGLDRLTDFWNHVERLPSPSRARTTPAPQPLRVAQPAQMPAENIDILLFAGKGGVGKTTLACAAAIRLARQYPNKEILLFSTDPAHSLSDCLAINVGPRECRLGPGLTAMEIEAEAEFAKVQQLYADEVAKFFAALQERASADMEFDRQVVERFLDLSPPGLDEVMALLRAMELMAAGKYDLFVLDTAPTGHLLRLLEMPDLFGEWLKVIFELFLKYKDVFRLPRVTEFLVGLSKKLKLLRSLLANPAKAQLYVVSVLTEMAYEETCDLMGACLRGGLHVPAILLNLVTWPTECPLCQAVAQAEAGSRARFAQTFREVPQTTVYRWEEPRGLERLAQLGQALFAS